MLHLEKTEIVNDIKKIIKETGSYPDIIEKYKEALEIIQEYGNNEGEGDNIITHNYNGSTNCNSTNSISPTSPVDTTNHIGIKDTPSNNMGPMDNPHTSNQQPPCKSISFKDYLRSNHLIVDSFIYTLHKKKYCPTLVIDYICTFLANSLLHKEALRELSLVLNQKSNWSEHEKMKILQMSFYLVREDFSEESAGDLFTYLLGLVDDPNKQISSTAKPITIQIIDYLISKCIKCGNCNKDCDVKNFGSDNMRSDVKNIGNDLSGNQVDNLKNNTNNNINAHFVHICINILQTNFSKRSSSRNLSLFYTDVLILVVQKKDIFSNSEFVDFFSKSIFPDLKSRLLNGSKEEKEKCIELLILICTTHKEIFNEEISDLLETVEIICTHKDFQYILPLILSLDQQTLKPHLEGILFNLLESFGMSNEMHKEVIFRLSEYLKVKSIDENGLVKGDDLMRDGEGDELVENVIMKNGLLQLDNTMVIDHHNISYENYASKLIKVFQNSKNVDSRLLLSVLEYSLQSENIEMFDSIVRIFMRINLEENLLVECINHRNLMKDAWDVVFENIKDQPMVIVTSLHLFNSEEIFYYTKSLTSNPTRWSLSDTLDFYTVCFEASLSILQNPVNVTIFKFYQTSLMSLLINSKEQRDDFKLTILSKNCELILEYIGNLDQSTPVIEKSIGEMLREALSLNVTAFGSLILQTLQSLLRLSIPDNWEETFLIIEMCSVSPLHSDLFLVLSLIIEKYLDLLMVDQYLILFACIEDICSSGDDELSDKAMMSMLEIGECVISRRILETSRDNVGSKVSRHNGGSDGRVKVSDDSVNNKVSDDSMDKQVTEKQVSDTSMDKQVSSDIENNSVNTLRPMRQETSLNPINSHPFTFNLWKAYLSTLYQFTNDPRKTIAHLSLCHLFRFIHSDSSLINPIECDFLFNNILIPLIEETTKTVSQNAMESKNELASKNAMESKNELVSNNTLERLIVLLDELSRHDSLKFTNISYLQSQLSLIETILRNTSNQEIISKCISPLSTRVHPPTVSIRLYQDLLPKRNQIHFENNNDHLQINETLFKFYKKLFENYEKYPPKVFLLLLDDLKRFDYEIVTTNIHMFDKALIGSDEVSKRVVEVLLSPEFCVNNGLCNENGSGNDTVLFYLLDFMDKSKFLAFLIMSGCKGKLRISSKASSKDDKIICRYLEKIKDCLNKYNSLNEEQDSYKDQDSLWDECLKHTQEVSRFVNSVKSFECFVELSKELFVVGMTLNSSTSKLKEGDKDLEKVEQGNKEKQDVGDKEGVNVNTPSLTSQFQIYNNKQFVYYLDHEPIVFISNPQSSIGTHVPSISTTLEFRRRERLLLNFLIVYYSLISKFTSKKDLSSLSHKAFGIVLGLTQIKNLKPFNFYNLAFKSYHLLFMNTSLVFEDLIKILKKVLKNYNEEEKLNNMLFSTIKQKEIYLVYELLIESKDKNLIENLKIEMLNCLKNKDLNVVEYVRRSLMILYE